eukprot:1415360-Prymnesium_polylepis.2
MRWASSLGGSRSSCTSTALSRASARRQTPPAAPIRARRAAARAARAARARMRRRPSRASRRRGASVRRPA